MKLLKLFILKAFLVSFVAAENFAKCLTDFRNGIIFRNQTKFLNDTILQHPDCGGPDALFGARNNSGHKVDVCHATALMYETCRDYCGSGQEPPNWSVFSKQFAAWLLPWLALISQLPFGAKYRLDNILSMLLTVGSPTLAAYSLILTVLNGHYVARRFIHNTYPNAYYAVRVLAGMQQSPLRIMTEDGLLASLVVLPENDRWWTEMTKLIEYEHTWSLSAFSSIAWVVIAYIFTVVDSFADVTEAINSNGQGVGSLWLWLIPIVVGWLQVSPKCDSKRLDEALKQANNIACVATYDPNVVVRASSTQSHVGSSRAFMFAKYGVHSPSSDEGCTSPVYNYSRFFSWSLSVEKVAEAFDFAARRADNKLPVDMHQGFTPADEETPASPSVHPDNRRGTLDQVIDYCSPSVHDLWKSRWGPHVFYRMVVASAVALTLQWATTISAVVVVLFTPTTGLGCRSGAYVLYGIGSTLIWAMMVASSVLAHHSSEISSMQYNPRTASTSQRVAAFVSVVLRRMAKLLATINAVWIVAACVFQFTNVFNTCYCNSSVLGRGTKLAYNVIELHEEDEGGILHAWTAAVSLSLTTAFLFIGFVKVFLDTPLPSP